MASDKQTAKNQGADTPMMAQYNRAKADYPDCLIFFRMGDFFELFFDDAIVASDVLGITLTKRGAHKGEPIPMAGVPAHSVDDYLHRLIRAGHRVAMCDQLESPAEAKARGGYKALVRREVTRVVTPGTVTEDTLLEPDANNFLAAIAKVGSTLGLAVTDISTGTLTVETPEPADLPGVLARVAPSEIICPDRLVDSNDPAIESLADWREALTPLPSARFDSINAERRLKALYGVASLDGFGPLDRAEITAAGALIDYIDLTQRGQMPRLSPPTRQGHEGVLQIDAATRRNLELTRTLSGERSGSLLSVINRTLTSAGGRLMAGHLAAPLTVPHAIDRRLDAVDCLMRDRALREAVREHLRGCPDLERALSRLSVGRGGPRDIQAIGAGLERASSLAKALANARPAPLPNLLSDAASALIVEGDLRDHLRRAVADDPPVLVRDGGFVSEGYSAALDDQRALRDESRRLIAGLQTQYRDLTDTPSLKIRHNNVLGYFVEATPKHADKLATAPLSETFIHRQTLASAVRFTTVELGELEQAIAAAGDKAIALELQIFDTLVAEILAQSGAIASAAAAVADTDVAASHAELAETQRFVRPLVDETTDIDIAAGRHPIVEAISQAAQGAPFVANDCRLETDDRLWLLTGPNMAGKSTFLRQNALIIILAQMGAFVPADRARIGVVDRLFSRVGAADDLARGQSTFMVEMVETAAILHQAGPRSFVILDEIGRGTATFDGLSIAWATVEHLHEVCRTRGLFATHYHELTALTERLSALSSHAMRAKEWQGDIVFLHEVVEGAADRSYGIHVARLAGLPESLLARADQVLDHLESGKAGERSASLSNELPLFAAQPPSPRAAKTDLNTKALLAALKAAEPDSLTPRQALDLLYQLRAMADETASG
ncbi:MAG: DNA mismatch repair protein MutS [Pseudomonadota bacterium]